MTALVNDPEQQQALEDACKARPELLFKAAEHAFGKLRQVLDVNQGEFRMIQWPDNQDIAEEQPPAPPTHPTGPCPIHDGGG